MTEFERLALITAFVLSVITTSAIMFHFGRISGYTEGYEACYAEEEDELFPIVHKIYLH